MAFGGRMVAVFAFSVAGGKRVVTGMRGRMGDGIKVDAVRLSRTMVRSES